MIDLDLLTWDWDAGTSAERRGWDLPAPVVNDCH